ncbi:MAG TPA: diadenosine tetraphosphate hydrolase [Mycobacteriales bacterium]|nr:diadenosine tetraphosphate hydrolase [Mycobacteriales bacterium]
MGDVQWLPGYCVLLSDDPSVDRLSALPRVKQREFLDSMALLCHAVERACAEADPEVLRVNVEILGNTDAYLHAHVWPRYAWEPAEHRSRPVWLYPAEHWADEDTALNDGHDALRESIGRHLDEG